MSQHQQQLPQPPQPPPPPPQSSSSPSSTLTHTQNSGHKVRRPRAARACNLCRLKKNKCDELYPCTYCRNRKVDCVYQGQDVTRGRFTPEYVKSLEEQVRQLSAAVEAQKTEAGSRTTAADRSSPALSGLVNVRSASQGSPATEGGLPSSPMRSRPGAPASQEVTAINKHTRNVEFYGSSSSVALLSQLQRDGTRHPRDADATSDEHCESDAAAAVLLSSLHNPGFSPSEVDTGGAAVTPETGIEKQVSVVESTHYRQCSVFLHNFFSSIHYIHPILDKTSFLERCEVLWSGDEAAIQQQASFVPLYYAVLSLGALVGYRDAEPIGGISNQQWSRKFFIEARSRFTSLEIVTDLEMVQSQFFLAKVCQNELNSHWSYFFTGLAGRTAVAMGINRQPGPHSKKSAALIKAEARTWWALYSLEEELSFAMGRPSSLSCDEYHNREFPYTDISELPNPADLALLDPPYCAIIRCMVDFSRITRHLCIKVYLTQNTTPRTIELAQQIEQTLDEWLAGLPTNIRPLQTPDQSIVNSSKEPIWMKRQKLVLYIRYLNLRILTFGSILLTSTYAERSHIPGSYEVIQKGLDAAKKTIETIHETYKYHEFFRTWSVPSCYSSYPPLEMINPPKMQHLLQHVTMAIEVLQTMADECVVAGQHTHVHGERRDRAPSPSPSSPPRDGPAPS
ncbi:bZIP transcription factor MafK transcription N-6 adenine-specific DNA methylase [Cryphonectria parasitica EP155]|uniref:BZIP transcription factor MafK transcription N-6 adenine-specific DNA methylase n=1 Tax=Cryphonectria parasitica (strain ATCC 38755 / EP155) TaxID=660469 RepID=A0A9P4Y3E0_CRYP1|nr:bZIP transcription factor MafK transcription N-6 adenine-specific DNA methylase [Cryphonectria parasitica EP155]KAF3765405.1 bZIP transcription factor MafK transcription N-6 adenine-specific DNA methylase [Cryphonectria parasitica EP155]